MKPIRTVSQLVRAFRRIEKRKDLGSREESGITYRPLEKLIEPEVLAEIGCTDNVTELSGWQRFRVIGPFLRVYLELKDRETTRSAWERLKHAVEGVEESVVLVADGEIHFHPAGFAEIVMATWTRCLRIETEDDMLRLPIGPLRHLLKEAKDCTLSAVFLDAEKRLHIRYMNGHENPGFVIFNPQEVELSPEDPVIHVMIPAVAEIPEEQAMPMLQKSFLDMLLEETVAGVFSALAR